jgi:predicted ATPase
MIKSIKLTNFFSFKEDEIFFDQRVNLLIGINGSGKSNLLRALEVLKTGVEGNANDTALRELIVNKWGGVDNIFCKGEGHTQLGNSIGLEFKFDGKNLSKHNGFQFEEDVVIKIILQRKPGLDSYIVNEKIQLESGFTYLEFMNGSGTIVVKGFGSSISLEKHDYNSQELALSKISDFDKDRYLELALIKKAIKDIAVFTYFDTSPESKLRKAITATSAEKKLLPDGSNLAQILNKLKITNKPQYRIIEDKLNDVNEMYSGFDFNVLGSGVFELMLDEAGLKSSIHVTHISDGTLRYLCLLSIFYNPHRGKFICIDEPETGLHPDMIYNITSAIKESSEETTYLIASHNENVLDAFEIENVRVFEKDENNNTRVFQFQQKEFAGWYEEYRLGKMWRAGDIGGNRW